MKYAAEQLVISIALIIVISLTCGPIQKSIKLCILYTAQVSLSAKCSLINSHLSGLYLNNSNASYFVIIIFSVSVSLAVLASLI